MNIVDHFADDDDVSAVQSRDDVDSEVCVHGGRIAKMTTAHMHITRNGHRSVENGNVENVAQLIGCRFFWERHVQSRVYRYACAYLYTPELPKWSARYPLASPDPAGCQAADPASVVRCCAS